MSGRSRWPSLVVAVVAATAIAGIPPGAGVAAPEPGPVAAARVTPQLDTQVSFPTRTVRDADGDTLLADASGRALQLHGANLGKTDDITEQDVADLGAAGFTLLRLPIQWSKLEPTQGGHDAAYLQHIEDVLAWADRYGLLVIVDWHQDVYGPYFPGFDGAPEWTTRTDGKVFTPDPGNWFNNYFDPAVTAAFTHLWNDPDLRQAQVDAWTYLAEQLAGSPALLGYDLFNEPMWTSSDFDVNELPAMYGRVIAGIRTVDQRSWLWIEPTVLVGEGLPTGLPDIDDPRHGADRIGYAPHAYSTSVEDGGDFDVSSGWVASYESLITEYPREHHLPVIIGEWGPVAANADHPGNVVLVARQTASFARFATGWAIWYGCRSADGGGYCLFSDAAGHIDPGRAAAARPYPLVLGGRAVAEQAGPGRYQLRYRPSGGTTTQVVVPSGFADHPVVSLTDARGHRVDARVTVSAPTRTGARTVTIRPRGPVASTWTLRVGRHPA
ncbi:MAG: cellulase family glycosylhydrolase [Nocardioides sp.]|nr:cellulase family glycosylhydrolase [Nocardioidaceae bacterium]MCB8955858.1 cellulase family glycosylhydrolase [Nocardioides sp.]